MKKPFYKFLLMGALLLGVTSCSDDNTESSSTPSFAISVPTAENYEILVADKAKEGDEVSLVVTPADGMEVVSVFYNDSPCTFVSSEAETNAAQYTFVMPACDVTLTAEVREMAPSEYAIHYENEDEFYFSDVPSTALAGSEVSFMITVTDLSIGITRVSYGLEAEEFCEPNNVDVGPDYKRYSFTFTMPDHEVSLLAAAAIEYNDITRIGDEHARVRLVNSIIKDENGDPLTDENGEYICRNYYGQLVKFVYEIELGYNYTMTIVGDRTGTHFEDKIYFLDSDFDAGQCWALEMPAEPITFTVVSSEKTDFVGKPFVGKYNGFFINTTQIGKLEKADAANLNVELKTNTVFEFQSSDVNAYNFRGMMSYDESDNQFEYLRESCDGYGLSGYWSETMTLAWVTNIIEDMPENTRFYIMSKDDLSNFVSAGNAGGTKYLLEVKTAQGTLHYLFERENYRLRTVDVDFTSGSSIGDASASGYVVEEGVKLLKYTCDGTTTDLIEKGKEAGSYSGSNGVLELDGFGGGKIGSQEGTYTITDGIVTLTCNGQETKYNIDMNAKTYSLIADDSEWDGPTTFYVEGEQIGYNKKPVKGSIKVTLDHNALGNYDKGKAMFVAQYYSSSYRMEDLVSGLVSYIYDAKASTLTLSQLLVGTSSGGLQRIDIVFSVSPDKQTLTFTGIDRIYSTNSASYYVTVTDLAVPAQE